MEKWGGGGERTPVVDFSIFTFWCLMWCRLVLGWPFSSLPTTGRPGYGSPDRPRIVICANVKKLGSWWTAPCTWKTTDIMLPNSSFAPSLCFLSWFHSISQHTYRRSSNAEVTVTIDTIVITRHAIQGLGTKPSGKSSPETEYTIKYAYILSQLAFLVQTKHIPAAIGSVKMV